MLFNLQSKRRQIPYKVPGRLTSAELRAMALRQQQQIDSQHHLLVTKEQRLRFLKQQEIRNAVANAESERLRRLRERVETQESKLRRLRALRGQVDLQKTYNVTLSNDLDSIRALFSEKEKELSLAVAKVEALTRQLEDLRRDRRCPINLIGGQQLPSQASRELDKLRRELMYRNQLSIQQDARLNLQREALQKRQAELRSVDQRIYELQTRLNRKRTINIQSNPQLQQHHQPNQNAINLRPPIMNFITQQQQQQQQPLSPNRQHQQQQQQQSLQSTTTASHSYNTDLSYVSGDMSPKSGVAVLKQQLLQKQNATTAPTTYNNHKFSNIINLEGNRLISRGNVAAVEPYIHTPHKSTITPTSSYLGSILKQAAATANTNQQNQLIQDHTHVKLNLGHVNSTSTAASKVNSNQMHTTNVSPNFFSAESDESKLAKKLLIASISSKTNDQINPSATSFGTQVQTTANNTSHHIYAEVGPKKRDLINKELTINTELQPANSNNNFNTTTNTIVTSAIGSKIPKCIGNTNSTNSALINKLNANNLEGKSSNLAPNGCHNSTTANPVNNKEMTEKKAEIVITSETVLEKNSQQLTVHSVPLGTANKSIATAASMATAVSIPNNESSVTTQATAAPLTTAAAKSPSLAVPPRKPISSVAPTSITSSIPKKITYNPKVNRVAPNIVNTSANSERPALPPKPNKSFNSDSQSNSAAVNSKKIISDDSSTGLQIQNINDNLPIKAKPLTIRKQPFSEQPRLKSSTSANKSLNINQQNNRKSDITYSTNPTHDDKKEVNNELPGEASHERIKTIISQQHQQSNSTEAITAQSPTSVDETDRSDINSQTTEGQSPESLKKRMRSGTGNGNNLSNGKPKLTRRVSFDPLALLLDASLEGELDLVKKTAKQVSNPSAANDEGITALHNAICAGHFDIVKFLVEFGCDVNAQDSDGWTPLHCAASCNNLGMVKFLVENGACLFAATLSDHETPAEKCEEDEEGFDGCSEYLYSIQEKLGILHNGEVYAVFSYEAQNSDELNFHENDSLIILRKGDDAESEWWWAKNMEDQEGYVPRNLLGLYPRVSKPNTNNHD